MLASTLRRHSRLIVVAAALLGVAARLTFGLAYWVDKRLTNDELEYLTLATNLSAGKGFSYEDPHITRGSRPMRRFGRAPGYPAFLALAGVEASDRDFRSTPTRVKVAQAFVGMCGVILIGALAAQVAGPAAGAIAAVIGAVYPPLVWICAYALSEALFSSLALLCVLVLGAVLKRPEERSRRLLSVSGIALAGGIAGLAALTRPGMLLFIAMCPVWLLARRRSWFAAAFVVGAAAVISPWTIWNAQQSRRFVLIAPQGGINFWIGNHRLARGEGDLAANPILKTADLDFRARHPGLDESELEPLYYREAIGHIFAHPVRWIALLARKFFYQWVPVGPSYRLHSTRYYVLSLVSYLLVLPLAVAGLVELTRRHQRPGALALLASSEMLAALIFFPQERYRIPVLDPTLIVGVAAWVALRALR